MIGKVDEMLRLKGVRILFALLLCTMAIANLAVQPNQSIGIVWDMAFAGVIVLFLASQLSELRARQAN